MKKRQKVRRSTVVIVVADGAEAAWRFGLAARPNGKRAVRALRILVEAVK